MNDLKLTPAALSALIGGNVENFITAATPGGIERQEAEGQRALVATFRQLPKDMGADGLKVAEALGFKIGNEVDELFVNVEAPAGWRMEATDRSMHSKIRDAEDRLRGSVFYKAAFYDRRAHGNWRTRYHIEKVHPDEGSYNRSYIAATDRATGETLWAGDILTRPEGPYGEAHKDHDALENAQYAQAIAALDAAHPEWRDVTAYW